MTPLLLDTNVILSIWNNEARAQEVSEALDDQRSAGRLLLCGPVYAELASFNPASGQRLAALGIEVDPEFPFPCWERAGRAFFDAVQRRKHSERSLPRRLLTDFLIGAHASIRGYPLFTLNPHDFLEFPEIALVTLPPR